MANATTSTHSHSGTSGPELNYLTENNTLKAWLTTVDHKRLGLMYLAAVMSFFFIGGIFALLLRLELLTPAQDFMDSATYNKVFTLHGAIMVFLFIIPSVPGALGNFVLPLMLGAKDVAFPRLNLASFYVYCLGAVMALAAIILGGVDTGWTFYTPYSTTTDGPVGLMAMAVFTLGFSSIFTGINFVATVHKLRAPGMGWFQLPLFVWGIYSTALIQVLATPVLGITVVLMAMERAFHIGIFDARLGGDPVLFQHFFWFYSHPAVYIMILRHGHHLGNHPGVLEEDHLRLSRHRLQLGLDRLHRLPGLGTPYVHFRPVRPRQRDLRLPHLSGRHPLGHQDLELARHHVPGFDRPAHPMLYAMSFLLLFAIGGLTGLYLGAISVDIHLHDTYFVVAHFHYVMMGGTVIAFLGGIHYWWPKMFGKMYNEKLAKIACWLIFIGFNVTF